MATAPDGMLQALRAHWGPVFSKQPVSAVAQDDLLRDFGKKFDTSGISPPDTNTVSRFLARAKNSAPKPDGLPYAAWQLAGHAAHKTFFLLGEWLACGPVF